MRLVVHFLASVALFLVALYFGMIWAFLGGTQDVIAAITNGTPSPALAFALGKVMLAGAIWVGTILAVAWIFIRGLY